LSLFISCNVAGDVLQADWPVPLGINLRLWCPIPTANHVLQPRPLPCRVTLDVGAQSPDNGAKFSPPPFAVVLESVDSRYLIVVRATAGWHRWHEVVFDATAERLRVTIDLQGQTDPEQACAHLHAVVIPGRPGEAREVLLARGLEECYPASLRAVAAPDWWQRPIYCGWGDQVTAAMASEGLGPEHRAKQYCRQALYERWLKRLETANVPVGTVVIDDGWSTTGSWREFSERWPDLQGFIRQQHNAGRRVLLWLGLWLWEGLPAEWCIQIDSRPLVADPTHPGYKEFLRERIRELLGPDGLNADGFKLDQLGYVPHQRCPRGGEKTGHARSWPAPATLSQPAGKAWGCEMLYEYQRAIYSAAKTVKPDALITSSTVHPYFRDTFDMVRLHDMGYLAPDVWAMMTARAAVAKAALPGLLIDTDNWIHSDFKQWLDYTCHSPSLGVPCLFYSERFMLNWEQEPATQEIPLADLRRIGQSWRHE